MWRVVGVGVGLLRHDGEVEGVVVKESVLRCIAEGVATRDGVCAYDSFSKRKFLKTKRRLCMREDQLAACGTRSS